MLAKAAVFILGILINYLESHKMNLSDRLKEIGTAIGNAAPHLASVASEAESAVLQLAPVVAASLPNTGAAAVATELVSAATAVEQVQSAIVGAVTANGAPAPGIASSTPVADTPAAPASAVEATATESAVAGVTAGAAATPSALETRLQLVESALFEMLPALAGVLKAFGK